MLPVFFLSVEITCSRSPFNLAIAISTADSLPLSVVCDYLFPELRTMNLGVINIHVMWRPMPFLESGSWKTWKSSVANQHLAKCVTACLRDIGCLKSQNNMGSE